MRGLSIWPLIVVVQFVIILTLPVTRAGKNGMWCLVAALEVACLTAFVIYGIITCARLRSELEFQKRLRAEDLEHIRDLQKRCRLWSQLYARLALRQAKKTSDAPDRSDPDWWKSAGEN